MTINELGRISEQANYSKKDETDILVESYFNIGMVYATRNARKGMRYSVVYAPACIHSQMVAYLEARGYDVIPFGGLAQHPETGDEWKLPFNYCLINW